MATNIGPLRRLSADLTGTAALAKKTPSNTEPTQTDGTNGIIDLSGGGGLGVDQESPDGLFILPYGSNAANEDYQMRFWGWRRVSSKESGYGDLWIPHLILEIDVTLGDLGGDLPTGYFMADTITIQDGDTNYQKKFASATGDLTPAYLLLDPLGAQLIEVEADLDHVGTAAAAANILYSPIG